MFCRLGRLGHPLPTRKHQEVKEGNDTEREDRTDAEPEHHNYRHAVPEFTSQQIERDEADDVVSVVITIGRKRAAAADRTADPRARPADRSSSIRSMRTIALLTMMPARARSPSIALKSSLAPDRFKPRDAPIRMSGIVKMMMSVRRKELNCQMRRTTIATRQCGI